MVLEKEGPVFMSNAPVELASGELAKLIDENAAAKTVYDWMNGRNISIKAIKSDDVEFQFAGTTDDQFGFTVAQLKKLPRSVFMASNLEILPSHVEEMNKLTPEEKDTFLWALKKELFFAPATFHMMPDGTNPKTIQFAKEISFDELTEGRLIDAMDAIHRCFVWTASVLVRKLSLAQEV